MIRSIAAFLFLASVVGAASAQSALLGVRPDPKKASIFFHADGREAFRLPAEFQLVQWQPDNHDPDQSRYDRELKFMAFDQAPIVLKSAALGFILGKRTRTHRRHARLRLCRRRAVRWSIRACPAEPRRPRGATHRFAR
jgi:hypothetical protein